MRSFFLFLALTSSVFALDASKETTSDRSIKKDQSMSAKKSNDDRSANRSYKSRADAKSYSSEVVYDPTPAYLMVADLCVASPVPAADFGLTSNRGDGVIDLNRKQLLESQAGTAMYLSEMGADEYGVKGHIACVLKNSAKMAQANLNLVRKIGGNTFSFRQIETQAKKEFSSISSLSDPAIYAQYARSMEMLRTRSCRFLPGIGHDTIQCGPIVYSFADNSVKFGSEPLTGNGQTFGISSSFRVSLSDTDTSGRERSFEKSVGHSFDAVATDTKSSSLGSSSKRSTSVAPFLPK